jgi:hypothetical protein
MAGLLTARIPWERFRRVVVSNGTSCHRPASTAREGSVALADLCGRRKHADGMTGCQMAIVSCAIRPAHGTVFQYIAIAQGLVPELETRVTAGISPDRLRARLW